MPDLFLGALGLPGAWAGQRQFALLEIAPPTWHNFLTTWQAWAVDPVRPTMLHYVVVDPAPQSPATTATTQTPVSQLAGELEEQLEAALWGLLPGFHRLAFSGGHVLLTVCIGTDIRTLLREQAFEANAVFVNASVCVDMADKYTLKALARCCQSGARVAGNAYPALEAHGLPPSNAPLLNLRLLAQCGFNITQASAAWQGEFSPAWTPVRKHGHPHPSAAITAASAQKPTTCLVIGAGLAGTAVAASLARRGWQVIVLDAADTAASGASSLPAGLMAPHVSPDDSPLSRLSRAGIRITLQQAARLLRSGQDWSPTGVLERCLDHPRRCPASWLPDGQHAAAAQDWMRPASPEQLAACDLTESDGAALWHAKAGWIKPAELARAWLATPGVTWRGRCDVACLQRIGARWHAIDRTGNALACGEFVVVAAGHATAALVDAHTSSPLPLQPIRGQLSWALQTPATATPDAGIPGFPVNGHGHLLTGIPSGPDGAAPTWLAGASYERDVAVATQRPEDDAYNLVRLHQLLPRVAHRFSTQQHANGTALQAWTGVRCATPARLPWVGPVPGACAGLWMCAGMGSRGLTFAALCAELLVAQVQGEPWPVERALGAAFAPRVSSARKSQP